MTGNPVFTLPLSFSTNDPITPALCSKVDKLFYPTSVATQVEQCIPQQPEANPVELRLSPKFWPSYLRSITVRI